MYPESVIFLPLYSNYVALMYDDIGPLTPNRLGPVMDKNQVRLKAFSH